MESAKRPQALVYLYQYWDEATGKHKTSSVYAMVPTIHNGLGTPLYDRSKVVDADDLQGGIFVPRIEKP